MGDKQEVRGISIEGVVGEGIGKGVGKGFS